MWCILSNAEQERKYIKIPKEILCQLKKEAKNRNIPVGVLIGVAIILLTRILTSKEEITVNKY